MRLLPQSLLGLALFLIRTSVACGRGAEWIYIRWLWPVLPTTEKIAQMIALEK